MVNVYEVSKIFLIGVSWWLVPLIIIFVYKKKLGKYPVECVIYEKRGENLVHTRDVAGRFEEPVTCYRLKVSKDSIPVPQYDWILQNMSKPTNLFEKIANLLAGKIGTITLFKYGSKQYKPVEVRIGDKVVRKFKEVQDKKGNPVWVTVYEPINVKQEMSRLDFEVIDWDDINHMTQELRAIATRRNPIKNFIEKYGPTIGIAASTIVMIIAIYYAYKLLMGAGGQYIEASRRASGGAPLAAAEPSTPTTPLDNFIPGK